MKKYAKLLCAVLVMVLLCTSLVFVSSAEDTETEGFKKSFEITDFTGNAITDGANTAKSSVEGNRVTSVGTINADNSPFLTLGKGAVKDPYLVAYANQDYSGKPTTKNNLGVVVDTPTSDPFTVVGSGAKGYYVIDFDIATQGNMLPGIDVSVVMRRASDSAGFPFSDELYIGSFITELDSWSHLTIVGDIANNVAKVYVNGVHVGDSGLAVRNTAGNNNGWLAQDTAVVALGYRIELTRNNMQTTVSQGDNVAFDNFAHRLYIEDGDALAKALADGDITDWAGYTSGRSGEHLPTIATVDGVEYYNAKNLAQALNSNDLLNVEFLAEPFVPVALCANAVINTNGMAQNKLFKLDGKCKIESVNGNIITTTAPFVSNYTGEQHVGASSAASLVKSDKVEGNIFSQFGVSKFDVDGGRTMYQVYDKYTGKVSYINERVYSSTNTSSSNTYNDWFPNGKKITYVMGTDQHIVIDFDIALHDDNKYTFKTVTRTSDGGSAWNDATTDITLDTMVSGYELGEFVHITMVLSTDTTDNTVFVNGSYVLTKEGNITGNTDHYFQCLRAGGNSSASVSYGNISMREIRSNELTNAITAKDISLWSGNVYDADYELPAGPAKVIIDGVPYSSVDKIEKALYGNRETPAVVKILHVFDETITVNCNANIYTYGQDVKFMNVKGEKLVPGANSIIRFEIPYMSVGSEEQITVYGGSDVPEIFDAIKGNAKGNLFTSFIPSVGNWGSTGYRNASLLTNIETHDVLYRDSAILNADGTVSADSSEYVDMKFKSTAIMNENNEYVVVDFDFGTDREITDDIFVQIISTSGAATENAISLKDLDIFPGDMAHVTLVYDFARNSAYAFVNGVFASMVEGIVDDAQAGFTVDSFRLYTGGKASPVCLDNVVVRSFTYADADDELKAAVDSDSLGAWSSNLYTSNYIVSKLPTLAVVTVIENGEEYVKEYGSIDTLNKFLAIDSDFKKTVEMKSSPATALKIRTAVTVDTHGLDIALDWNTGLYEFDPGVERYRSTKTGLAYATSKFIYTTVGTEYKFDVINSDNCWSNTSVAIWANDITTYPVEILDYSVVFYAYGEQMAPITDKVFLENGNKYTDSWYEVTIINEDDIATSPAKEYATASSTQTLKIYWSMRRVENNVTYAVKDMLYGSNIGTDIVFTLYVKKTSNLITDTGKVVNIDGVDYMAFDYYLVPSEIDKVITVSFEIKDIATTKTYTQVQDICYVDYLRKLLETTDFDRELIVSLLDYANKSHVLFEGCEMESVTELINEYAEYLPKADLEEKADTSALGEVIRSASMRLNSTPEFVFKVARGFKGTITFSYDSLGELVERTFDVNALASEQIITLDGLYIYDLADDITIKVTGSETCEGVYNLSTYAHGLENNDFAVALYNYALCAAAYKGDVANLPVN